MPPRPSASALARRPAPPLNRGPQRTTPLRLPHTPGTQAASPSTEHTRSARAPLHRPGPRSDPWPASDRRLPRPPARKRLLPHRARPESDRPPPAAAPSPPAQPATSPPADPAPTPSTTPHDQRQTRRRIPTAPHRTHSHQWKLKRLCSTRRRVLSGRPSKSFGGRPESPHRAETGSAIWCHAAKADVPVLPQSHPPSRLDGACLTFMPTWPARRGRHPPPRRQRPGHPATGPAHRPGPPR